MAAAAVITSACCTDGYKTDEIGINVTPSENREYSYTDKKSGYWYGRTHQDEPQEWYSGWNMAKRRVLSDYTLSVDGKNLDRADASCVVYPDRLVRQWDNAVETFQLVDNLPIIYIGMETDAQTISCSLNLGLIAEVKATPEQILFIPHEDKANCIMLAPAKDVQFSTTENGIVTTADAGGFILTYGNPDECQELAETFRTDGQKLLQERKERINDLITEYNPVITRIPANKVGIFNFVCKNPVTNPAKAPAKAAIKVAIKGFTPATINAAIVAAPKVKLPSEVKSEISKIR